MVKVPDTPELWRVQATLQLKACFRVRSGCQLVEWVAFLGFAC